MITKVYKCHFDQSESKIEEIYVSDLDLYKYKTEDGYYKSKESAKMVMTHYLNQVKTAIEALINIYST